MAAKSSVVVDVTGVVLALVELRSKDLTSIPDCSAALTEYTFQYFPFGEPDFEAVLQLGRHLVVAVDL